VNDDDPRLSGLRRTLYESNPLGETELSDVWLCLACALGWTVWLLSSRKQAEVVPSIFDQQQSIQVTGNVLEVTIGEDADGTGIPVYLALIDYVVECYDPDDDTTKFIPQSPLNHPSSPPREGKSSTEKFKKGVVLEHNSSLPTSPHNNNEINNDGNNNTTDKHLQIRKCFYTNKLLAVGFANVKVLCLVEDPTTSELWDDYLRKKRERKKPQNWIQLYMVYFIAVVLIVVSLFGGYRTVEHLPGDLTEAGYISLGIGALLLYPCALLLYSTYCLVQGWLSERKGIIIRGSERWHCTRMACGMHPIMEEDDGISSLKDQSSITHRQRNNNNNNSNNKGEDTKGLEMPKLHDPSNAEYAPPKAFRSAGCALNEYNVQTLQSNPSTVSSISSAGKSHATQNNEVAACQDAATSHLMEAFESMSGAFGTSSDNMEEQQHQLKPKTSSLSTLQKLGNLRRISSESRVPTPRASMGVMNSNHHRLDPHHNGVTDTFHDEDELPRIYSA